jgi:hypothetical protein
MKEQGATTPKVSQGPTKTRPPCAWCDSLPPMTRGERRIYELAWVRGVAEKRSELRQRQKANPDDPDLPRLFEACDKLAGMICIDIYCAGGGKVQ